MATAKKPAPAKSAEAAAKATTKKKATKKKAPAKILDKLAVKGTLFTAARTSIHLA